MSTQARLFARRYVARPRYRTRITLLCFGLMAAAAVSAGCGAVRSQAPAPHVVAAAKVEAQMLAKRRQPSVSPSAEADSSGSVTQRAPSTSVWRRVILGYSVRGRAIRATVGGPDGGRTVLVGGCTHW